MQVFSQNLHQNVIKNLILLRNVYFFARDNWCIVGGLS